MSIIPVTEKERAIVSGFSSEQISLQMIATAQKTKSVFQSTVSQFNQEQETPPSLLQRAIEPLFVGTDLLFIGRNAVVAAMVSQGTEVTAQTATHLAVSGGIVLFAIGMVQIYSNYAKFKVASLRQDIEGKVNAVLGALTGTMMFGIGIHMLLGTLRPAAAAATEFASGVSVGISYMAWGGYASIGLGITQRFRKNLDQQQNLSEKLKFLNNQLGHQLENRDQIRGCFDRLSRRTSPECVKLLVEANLDNLIKDVADPQNQAAIEKAKQIIAEVEKANRKEALKYGVILAIAVLGLTSTVLSMVFGAPLIVAVLGVISNVFWLALDSSHVRETLLDRLVGQAVVQQTLNHQVSE